MHELLVLIRRTLARLVNRAAGHPPLPLEAPVSNQPVELDPDVDDQPEHVEHPDTIDDDEAMAGHRIYRAVDDLDDYSNGLSS